ncbi:pneumococcal serine-rich repeat protein-like, partial [Anopheles bellator]|uniref:pneumococcal serine-rich repeat protein-like n=1 Tax=Anopheles bellator TaxID=139047 RepID=UPI002648FC9B
MDENEVMAAFLWSKHSKEVYSNQGLKDLHHLHQDFIINDYTDKIATNIDLLDTELKFAWAALNLLNEEYTKMSEKVFKLQSLNISQQRIVQNLQFMEENRKAYLDMIPDYAKHHEFSLQEQSRLRQDLEYRDRISEALHSGLQEDALQDEYLLQQQQHHNELLFEHQLQMHSSMQMLHSASQQHHGGHHHHAVYSGELEQQQQHQQQQQYDAEYLAAVQRNFGNVPAVLQDQYAKLIQAHLEAEASSVAIRSGPPAAIEPPPPPAAHAIGRPSTNPFLTAGEASRGLLSNIEPADSAAIIEEQLRTSFLNHAKQLELLEAVGSSPSPGTGKRYPAGDRAGPVSEEGMRELINKIMSEEDVASLSSEEMDRVRCFMARNCSELLEAFGDEELQAVYPSVKTAELLLVARRTAGGGRPSTGSPRASPAKYGLADGLATLTKDDLLTVANGTITIHHDTSASESDFRLSAEPSDEGVGVTTGGGASPEKLMEFSPFGLQATLHQLPRNDAESIISKAEEPAGGVGDVEELSEPTDDVTVAKTTIPLTFACTNLVGLTTGATTLYPGGRHGLTEQPPELTSCVSSSSDQLDRTVATPATTSLVRSPAIPVATAAADSNDTAAILQAIISRRSSMPSEASTSPPTFQPLPGQTSITDSPEMQAIYDSLSRKSSLPTLGDITFFPSLDITDSGFAGDTTSDTSFALFPPTAATSTTTTPAPQPVSLPDSATLPALPADTSDSSSSALHTSMNSSGISEASDNSGAFTDSLPPPASIGKLPALPPLLAAPTMATLGDSKPVATEAKEVKNAKPAVAAAPPSIAGSVLGKAAALTGSVIGSTKQPASTQPASTQPASTQPPAQLESKPSGGFFQATTANFGSFFTKVNKNLQPSETTTSTTTAAATSTATATDSTLGAKSKSFFASMKSSFSLDSSKASVDEPTEPVLPPQPQPQPQPIVGPTQSSPTSQAPLGGSSPRELQQQQSEPPVMAAGT